MNQRLRLALLLLVTLVAFPLVACGSSGSSSSAGEQAQEEQASEQEQTTAEEQEAGEQGGTGIANPFVDCTSASEASQIAGFTVTFPEAIPGYSERHYQAVEGQMIQCFYRQGDKSVLVRKAKGTDDISGDYNEYPQVNTVKVDEIEVTQKGKDDLVYVATWTRDGFSYAVDADEGLSSETIEGLVFATR